MKVYLVPEYKTIEELKSVEIFPDASVEAEYGNQVIEGKLVTLAHHAEKYRNNPVPCCTDTIVLPENAVIVISHIDLDTIGGCLSLIGCKPVSESFWEGAGFIDCNGIHHIKELPETVQEQLNSYYAWNFENHLERSLEIRDVTDIILEHGKIIESILNGNQDLLDKGKVWYKEQERKTESCLVWENEKLRIFQIEDNTFCAAAYYSPKLKTVAQATLSYNLTKKSITLAFEDGGKVCSAADIVRELWGELAGGHRGIAGSPRNQEMTKCDWERVQEKMKSILSI